MQRSATSAISTFVPAPAPIGSIDSDFSDAEDLGKFLHPFARELAPIPDMKFTTPIVALFSLGLVLAPACGGDAKKDDKKAEEKKEEKKAEEKKEEKKAEEPAPEPEPADGGEEPADGGEEPEGDGEEPAEGGEAPQ